MWYHQRVHPGASESVTAIRDLIWAARCRGVELDEGPTADEPEFSSRVAVHHAQRLWERAVRPIGPALPLLVAASTGKHLSLLYFATMSCRTLGEAIELTVEHWRYITDAFPASAVRRDGALHLQLAVDQAMPLGARLAVEYLVASLVRGGRDLTGGAWRPAAWLS